MPIDQSALGKHIADQMEAIENDPNVPEDAEISEIISIVVIDSPGNKPGHVIPTIRVRPTMPPLQSIGILEAAKAIQMEAAFGE